MGGIAVLTAPWWLEVLSVFTDWSIDLPIVDDLSKWLGFGIIIGALIYNYFMSKAILKAVVGEVAERKLNHDIKVFEETGLNSAFVQNFSDSIRHNNSIEGHHWENFVRVYKYLSSVDGKFHSPSLADKSAKLTLALEKMLHHLFEVDMKRSWNSVGMGDPMTNFPKPSRFHKYEFNDQQEFDTAIQLVKNVVVEYDSFRQMIKDELFI